MPKFKFEYEIKLNAILAALGMPDAFDGFRADFSRIAGDPGELFISEVRHKTYIEADARGTKAGAATIVAIMPTSAPLPPPRTVHLDRPFVFAIIDNASNLPIFIGAVMTVEE